MFQAIKQVMPSKQLPLYWTVITVWFSSLLFVLYSGGKLGLILFIVTTIITTYLISIAKWSGISDITGERFSDSFINNQHLVSGNSLHIKTSYKIPGFWPIPYVLLKDKLIHHQSGPQIVESSFVPDFYRSGVVEYSIPNLKRGHYTFGLTECSTVDLLNLFEHRSTINLPISFPVYPKTVEITEWPYVTTFRKAIRYTSSSRYQKETTELDGVREYIHGDRLSIIHWNASAKTGELKSKELVKESVSKVVVVMDRYKYAYQNDSAFELGVSTAASILRYLVKKQLPVGLFSPGKNITYYEPKTGKVNEHKLEEHLVYVALDSEKRIADALLNQKLKQLKGSLVVIISPDTSDSFFQRLQWLKRQNIQPCHICLSRKDSSDLEQWNYQLQRERIAFYSLTALDELPHLLGERFQ